MTGISDLLAGHAATDWPRNPDTADPAVQQENAMRNIPTARAAFVASDSDRELETCFPRNLPDRSRELYPIGPQVQTASRGAWVGTWHVIGRASSNMILQRDRKIIKWPKVRSRGPPPPTQPTPPDTDEGHGDALIPEDSDSTCAEDTEVPERQIP